MITVVILLQAVVLKIFQSTSLLLHPWKWTLFEPPTVSLYTLDHIFPFCFLTSFLIFPGFSSSSESKCISKATAFKYHDYATNDKSSALPNSVPANIVCESFDVLVSKVKLPCKTWKWDMSNQSCYSITYWDDNVSTKIVQVDLSARLVSLFFNSKRINPPNFKFSFLSSAELEEIVREFHSRKVCHGIINFFNLNSELTVHLKENCTGNIHSEHCLGINVYL